MKLSATHWTIVQAAQAGDAAAISSLCAKYRPAVVTWLERRGLGSEAEDVAQEAFLGLVTSALRRAQMGEGRFRGLVFAIARNQLARHFERAGAAKRGAGRVQPLGDEDVPAAEPDEAFDREWLAALVQTGLARLAAEHPNYFEALRRCALDGEPQAEVARALGITPGAVKKHVFRAKKKLGSYLQAEVWSYSCSPGEYEAELAYLSRLLGPAATADLDLVTAGSARPR
ncbi:MAG: RNA polymerase sigma factor [Planctomycetota bacterium]